MAECNFSNPGNLYEGRIERLQIQRSDGTIRESKKVNIHNTIVDTGLDNLLTVGGFGTESFNSKTINITNSEVNRLIYDMGSTIRMLWWMAIGTDSANNLTTYDMTDLVSRYSNSSGETFSQSHYIPSSGDLSIRGTTDDSMTDTDIHSTHRVTSNSIKVSEDGVEITEVGFFVGINGNYNTNTDFPSHTWTVGDMFCRIALGEHKVTLNAGERLVVTYALTEYASAVKHQAISSIGLVDANGDPILTDDGHVFGAIARCHMCDGKRSNPSSSTHAPLPGAFHGIHPTTERPCTVGSAGTPTWNGYGYNSYNTLYYPSVYVIDSYNTTLYNARYLNRYHGWNGNGDRYENDIYKNPLMVGQTANPYSNAASTSGVRQYNPYDNYGFPSINSVPLYYGSQIRESMHSTSNPNDGHIHGAGKCTDVNTDPTPRDGWNSYGAGSIAFPTVDTYYRCSTGNNKPASRTQHWVIPTYHPCYMTGSALPSPTSSVPIYWLYIRGMIYKLGYFPEGHEGVLDDFVQKPITKKAGQIIRITYTETVSRAAGV